jgi:hypothetical protein
MKISDTIQPPYISYKKPSEDMDSMEMMIERAVVAEFEKWREGRLTRWNRYLVSKQGFAVAPLSNF